MFSFMSGPAKAPEVDLKEKVTEWKRELRQQERQMDREIRSLEREQDKIKRECKTYARKGYDEKTIRMAAKNIVHAGHAIERLMITKAHLSSVSRTLDTEYAMSRVASSMHKSTAIMKSMGALLRAPELQQVMRRMGEEMQKAGIVEEMMEDAFSAAEPADLEDEADAYTEQVMYELTNGLLGKAPIATGALPTATGTTVAGAGAVSTSKVAVGAGMDELSTKLDKL